MTQVPRYGVKEQIAPADPIEAHLERLNLNGFTHFDAGLTAEMQAGVADAFDRAYSEQVRQHGGIEALSAIDEHNTIRAPLLYDPAFLGLAQNATVLAIAQSVFRGTHAAGAYILNQQNGISNPPGGPYNQGAWHRDLPYQHFTTSRPLAINALYCIDPFTTQNGATLVAPATHRQEAFPSDALLEEIATPVTVPAGHFLLLDCMLFHSGGANHSDAVRRAVNHVYTLPFIRQQIDLPAALGAAGDTLPDDVRRLLGFGNDAVCGPADYYARRRARLDQPGDLMVRRSLALRLLIAALIAALLAAVLDFGALRAAVTAIDWETLTIASLLMFAGLPVAALRWHLILGAVGGVLPRIAALRMTFLAMLVALGLPSGQGGDLVRGAMLASGRRTSLAQIISSTVADRLYGLLSIGLVALPGAIVLTLRGGAGPALTAVALGLTALPLVIPMLGPVERWLARHAGAGRTGQLAAGAADSLAQLRLTLRQPRVAAIAIACSLVIHGLAILAAWLMGRQIGLEAPLWQYLIAVPLVWVITMVPVSIGGIGVREASFGVLFGAFGASTEQGVALGALVSASGILGILLGGCLVPFLPRASAAGEPG